MSKIEKWELDSNSFKERLEHLFIKYDYEYETADEMAEAIDSFLWNIIRSCQNEEAKKILMSVAERFQQKFMREEEMDESVWWEAHREQEMWEAVKNQ